MYGRSILAPYILILVFFLFPLSCGNNNRSERLDYIKRDLIETYQHAEAIEALKKYSIENPGFQDGEINSSILLLDCYQATGNFEKTEKEYIEAVAIYKKLESLPVYYGFSFNGIVFMRYYNKIYKIINAKRQIDLIYKLNWREILGMKTAKNYQIYLNAYIRTNVDNMMNILAAKEKNEITNYKNDEVYYKNLDEYYIKPAFDVFLDDGNSSILLYTIADILNYKFEDGKYLSDIVWNRKDIILKYLKEFKNRNLLKKGDLERLRKYLYRTEFPSGFLEIWNSTF
jgi:hypothetical protein